MRFLITQAAKEIGVYHPVVALFKGVKKADSSVYNAIIDDLMARITTIKETVFPRADVRGFRELYKDLGHKKVVPAGEKLLKNCERKGEFPRYGNLVDAYNIVAFEEVTPIGVHDGECLLAPDATLIFRRAIGDEKIVPAFKDKEFTIPKGDLTYGIQTAEGRFDPFAWLGKQDTDSKPYQLKEETTTMLLTAIGNKHTSEEHNRMICQKAFDLLKLSCPDVTMELYTPEVIEEAALAPVLVGDER